MIIKNTIQLSGSLLRKDALTVVEAAFSAVIPQKAIRNTISLRDDILSVNGKEYNLSAYRNIYIVGFGKSSSLMAMELENILGRKITGGIVISTKEVKLERITCYKGTHPFPSQQNINATKELVELVKQTGKDDLILCLISGGGSALLFDPCLPFGEYTRKINDVFSSGVDIFELNRIRKNLSNVKGGKLAKMSRAKIVSLIFSDVIGDDLGTIASGPTYHKDGLDNVDNHLLLTNKVALAAMENAAKKMNYNPFVVTSTLEGEARVAVKKILKKCSSANDCFLFAGETVVKVRGNGVGGRNQEFCLAVIEDIHGDDEYVMISVGTDGIDGPGHGAAGAVVCNNSFNKARQLNLNYKEYLENNDAFHFFEKMEDLIFTGMTGSNVADIGVILKK